MIHQFSYNYHIIRLGCYKKEIAQIEASKDYTVVEETLYAGNVKYSSIAETFSGTISRNTPKLFCDEKLEQVY